MGKGRLEAFSDGVIAIIITIMVLELKVPHGAELADLWELGPIFLSYVLSFVYVGIYWNNHHHMLHTASRVSGSILWANLFLLFCLSLVPFTTAWMGENHFAQWPVFVYALNLLMAGIAYTILALRIRALHGEQSALARAMGADNKGKINLANAGVGSASSLCGMMFQSALAIDMTTVPYKGTAPAMNDLLGGQVDLMCDQTTNTTAQIEGKKVKAFGVTSPKRLTTAALKDVPTLQEVGLKDFQVSIWHGLYGPKGLPPAVAKKINDALKLALKDPEFIKRQEGLGAIVIHDNRVDMAEHKKFVSAEIAKWGPVIKAAGIYAD